MNTHASAAVSPVGAQPDYIAIAMVLIMALILIVMVIRKHRALKRAAVKAAAAEESIAAPAAGPAPVQTAPGSAGDIKLHDVEPRTAAMLMAIVADTMGVPLNELRFISVKEIK